LLTEQSSAGLTTYVYDESGNRIEKNAPAETTYYTWDEDSRLVAAEPPAGVTTLVYSADGLRVGKETPSESRKFIYDFRKLLQETDGADDPQRWYTFTTEEYGDLISQYDGADTLFHQYDGLGSTDALLDEWETATDRYAHRAFGLEAARSGTTDNPFTYVGRQSYYKDPELELYLLGARYYDPQAGRFLSHDPLRYQSDDVNLYAYVHNNPVNGTDPSGQAESLDEQRREAQRQIDRGGYIGAAPGTAEYAAWMSKQRQEQRERMIAAADERGDPRMLTHIGLFLLPSHVNPNTANLENLVMSAAPFVAVGAQPQISSHAVHGRPAQARRGVGGDPARRPARRPTTGAPPKPNQAPRPVDSVTTIPQNLAGQEAVRQAEVARRVPSRNHPVDLSTAGRTAEEAAAIREYARRANQWLDQSGPATIQSTEGTLRREASAAARAERLRAARAGQPYGGQAGHVPDTAVTGQANPPGGWLDMPGSSNQAAGGVLGSRIGQRVDHFTVDGEIP
jgi:RHS repeat-associated protein